MNSTQPSLARVLLSRELGQHRRSKQPSLDHGRELHHKLIGSTFVAPTGSPSMPYAVTFCKHIDQGHLLATSCEDGFVSILDASKKLPCYITGEEGSMPRAHWQAHRNAVFDVVWAKVRDYVACVPASFRVDPYVPNMCPPIPPHPG